MSLAELFKVTALSVFLLFYAAAVLGAIIVALRSLYEELRGWLTK